MPDASQVYDTIHLDVTVGDGFSAAQTRIDNLIAQLQELGSKVTPIKRDTCQIDQAIEKLRRRGPLAVEHLVPRYFNRVDCIAVQNFVG